MTPTLAVDIALRLRARQPLRPILTRAGIAYDDGRVFDDGTVRAALRALVEYPCANRTWLTAMVGARLKVSASGKMAATQHSSSE